MNSLLMLIISILIINDYAFSKESWKKILPPSPTSNQLVSLYFIDQTTGWAVGEYGTILKTTDAGDTWRIIEIPQLNYLRDVYFPTESTGYIVGEDGLILKSIDSGETWFPQSSRFTNNLHQVLFEDELTGWIIGEKGLILHTDNGGDTWKQQMSHSRENLNSITIYNEEIIYIVGDNKTILKSSNRGKDWEAVRKISFLDYWRLDNYIFNLNDIFFLNERQGWIGGIAIDKVSYLDIGFILKTNNYGQSWNQLTIQKFEQESYNCGHGGNWPLNIIQIYFSTSQHGICHIGPMKTMNQLDQDISNISYATDDGGKSWLSRLHGYCPLSEQEGRFFVLNENKTISTAHRGEFRFSTDGGFTWNHFNQFKRNFSNFVVLDNGILLGLQEMGEFISGSRRIQHNWKRSVDFGRSWRPLEPQFYDQQGHDIAVLSYFHPYYCRFDSKHEILHAVCHSPQAKDRHHFQSADNGLTWHLVIDSLDSHFIYPKFLTPDTLIEYYLDPVEVLPDEYKPELRFVVSFNGGRTAVLRQFPHLWNEIEPCTDFLFERFISNDFFINTQTGFLIGSEGNIIKTNNCGQTWRNIPSGVVEDLWDITFINKQVGFVTGNFGRILKTEDGGETWRKTHSSTQENVYSIAFKSATEGYAGTTNGLLYTTDAGETWQKVSMRYIHGPIKEIVFDKSGNGFAYTYRYERHEQCIGRPGGYILLLVLKNDEVSIANENQSSPYSFALHPNYPNPFNSTTIFRFSLPETEAVTLTIYNIRGQLVRTLVDKSLESGEHEVTWNGVNQAGQAVASGVYVARLRQQGEVKTRKVVVLR